MVNVSCPVLFIHGASDTLIPVDHSKTLFGLCRARKLLVTPPKMDHNSSMFSDPLLRRTDGALCQVVETGLC